MKKNIFDITFLSFILVLIYIIFFRHLGEFTLRLWDEGRNATNALEMLRNHNPIVTFFNGQPDMWNVKPPLHIWLVAIFFKLFGISELSLRLPSAISAALVVIIIYIFSQKVLKNRWIGLLGSLIILSSMGFPDTHIGRTGDYDALLTLFVFTASIYTFVYLENFNKKYIYLSFVFWTLAIMTKSVAALFMIPGIFIYILIDKKLIKLIKQKYFWKSILVSALIITTYYLSREFLNRGYINAVYNAELFGRYKNDIGSGGNDFWYYWKLLASFRFQKLIYFLPLSILTIFLTKDKFIKKFVIYFYILAVSYFIIISKSETKQLWYDAQLYPIASLLIATFIVFIIKKVPFILRIFPIIILCFYMQRYIRTNIAYIHRPDLDKSSPCVKYGYLFKNNLDQIKEFTGADTDSECSPFQFYFEKNNLPTKKIIDIKTGDKILTCNSNTYKNLTENNNLEILFDNKDGCFGLEIKANK